jgi:hypothetical protein
VLSNRIWIMPQQNRAGCGSGQGRVAAQLPLNSSDEDFAAATTAFIESQLAEYRALRRSKQKNPSRNLKKYFDRDDIRLIDDAIDSESDSASDSELARRLL